MSDITFKAKVSPELADQSNDALGLPYNMQCPGHRKSDLLPPDEAGVNTCHCTVVQPLNLQIAEVGLHLAFMQPLILGAALINVLAAADVHALVVDADLVEVVPVNANSPPAMASVYRGCGNG